jgi:hypothetical protein
MQVYGAFSLDTCIACTAGQYQSGLGLTSNGGCTLCPVGTYSTSIAANSSGACIPCPIGTFQSAVGQSAASNCVQCVAGRYSLATGSTAAADCLSDSVGGEIALLMRLPYDSLNFDTAKRVVVSVSVAAAVGVGLADVSVSYIGSRRATPVIPAVLVAQPPNVRARVAVPRESWVASVATVRRESFQQALSDQLVALGLQATTGSLVVVVFPMRTLLSTSPAGPNTTVPVAATPIPPLLSAARVVFSVSLPLSAPAFRLQQGQYILAVSETMQVNAADISVTAVRIVNGTGSSGGGRRSLTATVSASVEVDTQVQTATPPAAEAALARLSLTALGVSLEARGLPQPTKWINPPALGNSTSTVAPPPPPSRENVAPMAAAVAGSVGAAVALAMMAIIGWSCARARGWTGKGASKNDSNPFAIEAELGFASPSDVSPRKDPVRRSDSLWRSLGIGERSGTVPPDSSLLWGTSSPPHTLQAAQARRRSSTAALRYGTSEHTGTTTGRGPGAASHHAIETAGIIHTQHSGNSLTAAKNLRDHQLAPSSISALQVPVLPAQISGEEVESAAESFSWDVSSPPAISAVAATIEADGTASFLPERSAEDLEETYLASQAAGFAATNRPRGQRRRRQATASAKAERHPSGGASDGHNLHGPGRVGSESSSDAQRAATPDL